ncbi:MAG: hypothetical protein WC442_01815 [Candidatus Omnitrophota bacterium]
MKKVILAVFMLLNFVILGANDSFAYTQEQVEASYIKGTVAGLDFIKSTITIQYPDQEGNNKEIKFRITSHTKIARDDLRLEIKDIHKGDEAAIEYYNDPMSFDMPEASQVNLKPSGLSTGSGY